MDVVRYTDTYGYEWDNPAKGAHEYRDYLIRAFNDDIGFDQLLREQLAGDLISPPRIHPKAQTDESIIGPMFYHLGEHRHGSSLMFNGIHQEMVNNKIDAFSKAFLATTVRVCPLSRPQIGSGVAARLLCARRSLHHAALDVARR